jgi:galactose mutarotase-like enzyme
VLYELSNEFLSLKISAKGAEMHSVFSKKLNREILWQADPAVWARHAPVLFPIVGKLKNDSYTFGRDTYSLPQHGFARDKEFKATEVSGTDIVFELREDESTLAVFPFPFILKIRYSLEDNTVKCDYTVRNPSERDMYYSIGAHPGFICPLFENEKFSGYTLEFEHPETSKRQLLEGGLRSGAKKRVIKDRFIPLTKDLFSKDAIVLDDLKSNRLKLTSSKYTLFFNWYRMPYFGIWTKAGCESFVCLEPWAGVADDIHTTGDLGRKEGIYCLSGHSEFNCGFSFSPCRTEAE